ncbi:MAG: P-loop NTPase [Desulfohalobiaceae bacterium]|nr:P-loop NTPase [Desulfohalobiaceae bacterium]
MKELVVISGKGGTGKTSLTAAFAALAENMVLCDADVDAADLHLLMSPRVQKRTDFMGGGIALIDREECTQCGMCLELCRFEAISPDFEVDPIACEGCGVCVDFCPEQAIEFPIQTCGEWFVSETRYGPMVHARLGIAEENSGKLVATVRQESARLAEMQDKELIITDGPPGVGCPVIASIGGATGVVIVTEPTVSGLHDMRRVAELCACFKVPAMVVINKFDLNLEQTGAIERFARDMDIEILGRISFDPVFTKSMVQGRNVVEYSPESAITGEIQDIWKKILALPLLNPA